MGSKVIGVLTAEGAGPATDLSLLIQAQAAASVYEKSIWTIRPHKDLWRDSGGHFLAPNSVLYTLMRDAHGQDHCAMV